MICTLLAGNAAEELIFNEISSGASNDIKQATDIAHRMVTDFGMSPRLGPRTFGDKQEMIFLGREIAEQKDYGTRIANAIDKEVNAIIWEGHQTARDILIENKDKLVELADKLITKETLEGEELDEIFKDIAPKPPAEPPKVTPTPVPIEPVAEVIPEEKPKKAPGVPRLIPKQTPASPD
jgi:cell division protease FtsH